MTDWTPRELDVDLSFLETGTWTLVTYEDGPNAHRIGDDYKRTERAVRNGEVLRIRLAPGGGWVGRIVPTK